MEIVVDCLRPEEPIEEFADAIADAFADYPVMKRAFRDAEGCIRDWVFRLVCLTAEFRQQVEAPIVVARHDGRIVGGALCSWPGYTAPEGAHERFDDLMRAAGPSALPFFEAFFDAIKTVPVPEPHTLLNMIGVRRQYHGKGIGKRMIEKVVQLSDGSLGVMLDTENPTNVEIYRRCGFEILGQANLEEMTIWVMWRPIPTTKAKLA